MFVVMARIITIGDADTDIEHVTGYDTNLAIVCVTVDGDLYVTSSVMYGDELVIVIGVAIDGAIDVVVVLQVHGNWY